MKVTDRWEENDRLFTQWDGKPMFPNTISQWFNQFLKRKGLPHLTFHGLRHTNTTLLINQGVNIKAVSSRLGHSTVSTTLDIYSHSLRSADIEAADKLDNLFNKMKEDKQQA